MFISKKIKKFKKEAFGFVRYANRQEARNAIKHLDGFAVKGMKLKVLMARYNKEGSTMKTPKSHSNEKASGTRVIKKPSFREHRTYFDVLSGKRKLVSNVDEGDKTIPICFALNASENIETVKMLDHAIIAKNSKVIDLTQAVLDVSASVCSVKGMFSLSPTKILIVLELKNDAENAVAVVSVLWNVFDDIRLWSEGDRFDDRIVWIECYGIHLNVGLRRM